MAIKRFKHFLKGIVLRGETSNPNEQIEGSLYHNETNSELGTFLDGLDRKIITDTQVQVLENKNIDADDNLITNIRDAEIAADADISVTKIQYLENVTSDVQAQIDSKASQVALDDHINDPTDAHDASAIGYDNSVSGLAATEVQAAIDELSGSMPGSGANKTLSNLTSPTAINQALLPGTVGIDIGSSGSRFSDIYADVIDAISALVGPSFSSGVSSVNITAEVDLNNNKIINANDPTNPQDVATKAYVDSIAPSGTIDIEQNGTPILSASKLNFVSGAVITDGGSGEAEIVISGGGGSINPGTTGVLPKYDNTGTNVENSSVSEDSTYLILDKAPIIKDSEIYFNDTTNDRLLVHTRDANATDRSLFVGYNSAQTNTGSFNTALGHYALVDLTSGDSNVAVGMESGRDLTSGTGNTFIGHESGLNILTGSNNISIGRSAMSGAGTGGQSNIAIGNSALVNLTTAESNVAIGGGSLGSNTVGGFNTVIGRSALANYNGTSNITGYNVALGYGAGGSTNGESYHNIFIGANAGPTVPGAINNRLYIQPGNVSSDTPLIYGERNNFFVRIHNYLQLPEAAEAATPASGYGVFYVKTDGNAYFKNDSGTEYLLNGGSPGSPGANTTLSNLTSPTAINQDLIPSGTINLGSTVNKFNTLFTGGIDTNGVSIISSGSNRSGVIDSGLSIISGTNAFRIANHINTNYDLVLSTIDSTNTKSIYIATGDGVNSGDISIETGSASTTRGKINLSAISVNLPQNSSDPSSGVAGDIYYNTTTNVIRFYNGTAWSDI